MVLVAGGFSSQNVVPGLVRSQSIDDSHSAMTAIQRPTAAPPLQRRSLDHCRSFDESLDDSPEAVLLRLGAEIRHLSGERSFRVELLLMEQIFVLLLEGFRPQRLPGGLVGLLPLQPGLALNAAGSPPQSVPATAQDQAIAALCMAGMGWVMLDGQVAALCFPSPAKTSSPNAPLSVDNAEAHPPTPSGDRLL